jgi:DNA-binding cell septation regulator SpoVG
MFQAGLRGQTCGSANNRRIVAEVLPQLLFRLWGFLCPIAFRKWSRIMKVKHSTIRVDSIRLLTAEPGANVRALADITIDSHLHLRDLRIVQPNGQQPYIQPPMVRTIRPDGTPHYTFKATWEPTLHEAIETALLDAYKAARGAKR